MKQILKNLTEIIRIGKYQQRSLVIELIETLFITLEGDPHMAESFILEGYKYIPLNLLCELILSEQDWQDKKLENALIHCVSVRNLRIRAILATRSDLPLALTSKLALTFKKEGEKLAAFTDLFASLFMECDKDMRNSLLLTFRNDFCMGILMKELSSMSVIARAQAVAKTLTLVKSLDSEILLLHIVDAIQQDSWKILLLDIVGDNEELAILWSKLVNILVNKGCWSIIHELFTSEFSGETPDSHVGIDAETFLAMVPTEMIEEDFKENLELLLNDSLQRITRSMNMLLTNDSQLEADTGHPKFTRLDGCTGGTPKNKSNTRKREFAEFYEGELLEAIIEKLRRFLTNPMQLNIYLTGVIAALAIFPKVNTHTRALHNFLFEPKLQSTNTRSLIHVLKEICKHIHEVLSITTDISRQVLVVKRALGVKTQNIKDPVLDSILEVREKHKHLRNRSIASENENRALEGIVVYNEFLKEMASILTAKEIIEDMRLASIKMNEIFVP